MKSTSRSVWAPTLLIVVAACGGNTSVGDPGGPDGSLDVSSTGGSDGSPTPTTTGAGGATTSAGGAGGAGGNDSTTGTGGTGTGGSTAGSAGSIGTGGSVIDAGSGGKGGSTTGSGGASAGGAAGSGGAGAGSSGTGGSGGSIAGAGGVGAGGSSGGTGGGGTGGSTAGSGGTAGAGGSGTGGSTGGAGGIGPGDASPDVVDGGTGPITTGFCGGVKCGSGQDCCLLTAKCFDLTDRAACPKPPLDSSGNEQCGSNSDCLAGQFCESNSYFCTGPGSCQSRTNCGWSQDFLYCGCNGISYPNYQSSCADGARLGSREGAGCGMTLPPVSDAGKPITLCGLDSQCPTGNKCCGLTGRCYDPVTENGICMLPPAGTRFPCIVDSDCYPDQEYCAGPTCSGPGGCKEVGGNCNGELSPVCACNGKNYMNASCADISGVRVRHTGYCTDADTP